MKATEAQSNPYITKPSDVPAAGGCSVLVTTMRKIPIPTESAAAMSSMYRVSEAYISNPGVCRVKEMAAPMKPATK